MPEEGTAPDRREQGDRREHTSGGERRGAKKTTSPVVYVLRSLALIVVLLLIIVYTVVYTRPVFATRGTVGEELRKRAPEVAKVIAPPGDTSDVAQLMATPKFQEEKRNFYGDVMRL